MLLLTMNEWFGPSNKFLDNATAGADLEIVESVVAFVTERSLQEALIRIKEYESFFNNLCEDTHRIKLSLVGVATIDLLPADVINGAGLVHVERLGEIEAQLKDDLG